MKSHARVVVIGGGVVGVSTLYHLAKKGWSDVVLVERKELTSGSTWHAAGLLPLFNMSYSVGQIHKYSVKFYQELQEETGMDVGFRNVSNIRLASNQDRMDEFRQYAGVASTIGVQVDFLTPEQILDYWPMANIDGLVGAIRHPEDGYIQPADLTQALARGARDRGAEIYRNTAVVAITRSDDGLWIVSTDKGDITCEHVVSATGNFARKTGEMVGPNHFAGFPGKIACCADHMFTGDIALVGRNNPKTIITAGNCHYCGIAINFRATVTRTACQRLG